MKTSDREQPLILVVTSEQAESNEIAAVLAAGGFVCHGCTTAETALEMAPQLLPDLIIADVSLQGISGVELCAQLKQNAALAEVPVMFLAAGQIPDIIRRHDGDQGTYYLRKPFDTSVLLQLVDKAFCSTRLVALADEP
jgi:CheY-like chemotaxis protein